MARKRKTRTEITEDSTYEDRVRFREEQKERIERRRRGDDTPQGWW